MFNGLIDWAYGPNYDLKLAMDLAIPTPIPPIRAIWAVLGALLAGILTVFLLAFRTVWGSFAEGSKAAIGGELLAAMNTASEYGFGAVIAALPGFLAIRDALGAIPNPLVREAVTVTSLAGITGSASGGMSIALAAMSKEFIEMANVAHIPMEVLHRIASMASGGMDTLPHNGAVITLLAVCGLTHRESYRDIFAVTVLKTAAVFVVIGFYDLPASIETDMTSGAKHPALPFVRSPEKGKVASAAEAVRLVRGDRAASSASALPRKPPLRSLHPRKFGDDRLEELFMNIGGLLPRHARYRPDHLALVVGDQRLTYQKLNAVVNRLANALLANGITKGEKIATVLPNCLELMTAYWAAAKTGIVIVPMSTLLQEGGLATLLRDSDSVAVLAEASFAQTLDRIRGELPALRADRIVLVGCQGEPPRGFRTYEDFTAGAAEENPPDPGLTDADVYNIMYSSGTTGARRASSILTTCAPCTARCSVRPGG